MTVAEVRQRYLKFFEDREHKIVPSASLVPENDPTTLFTGSGMQPMLPYLLGQAHPLGTRIANSQKCFRAQDIKEVGDGRHTTFFEMLGNWSLGDYWKQEQLSWVFEFLTGELGIPKEKLWVSCFDGDEKLGLPRDTESEEIWGKLGIPKEHIRFYGVEKNWWSRSGTPDKMPVGEPGGPDSEIFYEFTQIGHNEKFGEKCHPNCDCGRFMEIGNSVFMEYRKTQSGFEKLKQRNVDFGGGLERITAAVNNEPDIFQVDVFSTIISRIEEHTSYRYADNNPVTRRPFRIMADHVRATVFLMCDGVLPSNTEQGYFVRRLLRRAIKFSDKFRIAEGSLLSALESIIESYSIIVSELKSQKSEIAKAFSDEEVRFRKALQMGTRKFEEVVEETKKTSTPETISGHNTFVLSSTYGLPFDVVVDMAAMQEPMMFVDGNGFMREFRRHQEVSGKGADKKFKGGLADTSEMSLKYHTATHLLHQALRDVLGEEVRQKGSNITPERLRFDFAFSRKMTDEEKKKVEDTVNEKIKAALPVQKAVLPFAEAEKTGALHFFGEKYDDTVSIYFIGNSLKTAYSKEFCGGPHVTSTGALGTFKIIKEEAVSAGVRRIKATLT